MGELVAKILATARHEVNYLPRYPQVARRPTPCVSEIFSLLEHHLTDERADDPDYRRFITVKLMEGDSGISLHVEL